MFFFFFKQKTAYEMRISDWSSDVCSSDLQLAKQIGRPDLGVMIGRSAQANSLDAVEVSGFPTVRVPAGHESNWTFIHAIARQESQCDRQAVSHAGARGMMQLMPGTAREVAGKLGLGYNAASLTSDTNYNLTLGSTYFR